MTLGAQIKQEKGPRLYAVLINRLEQKLPERCRYFFVVAGTAGLVTGFTGLVGELPAAGAGTPD